MNVQEKRFTLRQLAEILPLHIDTLRRYCREGKISPVEVVGNRILVPESTLLRFQESHRSEVVNA